MFSWIKNWWEGFSNSAKVTISLLGMFLLWLASQLFGVLVQESYVFANYIWEPLRLLRQWDPTKITNQDLVKPILIARFTIMFFVWLCILAAPFLFISTLKYRNRVISAKDEIIQVNNSSAFLDFEDDIKQLVYLLEDSESTQRAKDLQLDALFESVFNFVIDFYGQTSDSVRATLIVNLNSSPLPTDFKWGGWRATSIQQSNDLQMITEMNTALITNHFWTRVRDQYPDADKNTALLIRNIGTFKLGILFSFKKDFFYEEMLEKTQELSKAILPFSLLGLIDSLRDNVILYNAQGGGKNAG